MKKNNSLLYILLPFLAFCQCKTNTAKSQPTKKTSICLKNDHNSQEITDNNTTQTSNPYANLDKENNLYLFSGQSVFVKELQSNIEFVRVLQDSRCPAGQNCAWQGNVSVEIRVIGTYSRPQTITLESSPTKEQSQTQFINNKKVTIIDLTKNSKTGQEKLLLHFDK